MKKLNDPQETIYQALCEYWDAHGFPPTVREICSAVGLSSPATVYAHLSKLEQNGRISRVGNKMRAYRINRVSDEEKNGIPLLGKVAAGVPIGAVENVEDRFTLPRLLVNGSDRPDCYMLHVQGDSMLHAGILDGDVIVVNRALEVHEGDIVVARIDGSEVTVKRLYPRKSCIELRPENELYEPICVSPERVEIIGKVTGLMRKM